VGHGISLLKTLARKHRSAVSMMARKYKATIDTPRPRKHPVGAEQVIHIMRPGLFVYQPTESVATLEV
jgi:hypothetical protein